MEFIKLVYWVKSSMQFLKQLNLKLNVSNMPFLAPFLVPKSSYCLVFILYNVWEVKVVELCHVSHLYITACVVFLLIAFVKKM